MKLPLSTRLLACASFVRPGDRVADIGCDHGYLGIHLLKNNIASSMIEADINEDPLNSARRNAARFGTSGQTSFCLSDGLNKVPHDFDCMVCAGMGADTMISILQAARDWLSDPKYRLILQCQSKRPELRQWLSDAGYRINRETLAKDGKFVYSIMEVVFDPGHGISPAEAYISMQLIADNHPLLPEYFERVKSGVELTIFGLKRAADDRLSVYENILSDLVAMEEQIYGNRG